MPVVHRYDPPERFVAGTVGPPGQRTFFLQARSGNRITSVALEKQQVAVLAEKVDALLDEVMRGAGGPGGAPGRLRLQAGRGGTAAVGLPVPDAGEPGAGGVPGLRGPRLGRR